MSTAPQPGTYASSSHSRFTCTKEISVETCLRLNDTLQGRYVGPGDVKGFVKREMPGADGKKFPLLDFSKVLEGATVEVDMYEPIVRAILQGGVLPDNAEIFISAEKHSATSDFRPDIGIHLSDPRYKTAQSRTKEVGPDKPFDFVRTALAIEVKFNEADDPFVDNFSPSNPFENKSKKGCSTRGQMAKYGGETLSKQQRCFIYQILIFRQWARLYRWDHSGAVVTARFDYIADPETLGQFLWGYCNATPADQGLDPTVSRPTSLEKHVFKTALYAKFDSEETRPIAEHALDHDYQIVKMQVEDGENLRQFIVGRPAHIAPGPCGRATRVYYAYDLEDRGIKILKDFWSVHHPSRTPEWEVYQELQEHAVPSLLEMTCGGYVRSEGDIQITQTQGFLETSNGWHSPCLKLETFAHGRLVQEPAYEAEYLVKSKEFVMLLLDVLKAIQKAHQQGILHRDVTFGNVLFTRKGDGSIQGFLNDWDHAIKAGQHGGFASSRSTTWQFMSIDLLNNPAKVHALIDDLESVYWVLLYGALHFFSHGNPTILLATNFFDDHAVRADRDGNLQDVGGKSKLDLLLNETFKDFPFDCRPLRELVTKLSASWGEYYVTLQMAKFSDFGRSLYDQVHARMSDVSYWIDIFTEALKSPDWEPNDAVADKFPARTSLQSRQHVSVAVSRTYDSSHLATSAENAGTTLGLTKKMSKADLKTKTTGPQTGDKRSIAQTSEGLTPSGGRKRTKTDTSLTASNSRAHGRASGSTPTFKVPALPSLRSGNRKGRGR